jgi:hypothetical protein
MKTYGGVGVEIPVLFILAVVGGEWSASRSCRFTPWVRAPVTDWIGRWLDPRAGLDDIDPSLTRTPTPRSSIPQAVAIPAILPRHLKTNKQTPWPLVRESNYTD